MVTIFARNKGQWVVAWWWLHVESRCWKTAESDCGDWGNVWGYFRTHPTGLDRVSRPVIFADVSAGAAGVGWFGVIWT